jgi:hypothetical protein
MNGQVEISMMSSTPRGRGAHERSPSEAGEPEPRDSIRQALTVACALLLGLSTSGCAFLAGAMSALTYHESGAGEAVIYKTSKFELRVVRRRQADAFSTIRYSYAVECGANREWIYITGGGDSTLGSAAAIADQLRREFQLYGDDVLVWMSDGLPRVYADRCTSIRQWVPWSVGASLIDPAPIWPKEREPAPLEAKPWFCARPDQDCRQWEFGGERRVRYINTKIDPNGTISFDAHSTAFKSGTLHVESRDWGQTWRHWPKR